MPNLITHLKKVSEQKPQATYYNVDMLKYQVRRDNTDRLTDKRHIINVMAVNEKEFNCHLLYCIVQVSVQGQQSTPLNLAVSWRCEPTSTDLRIDYKYNGEAMSTPTALNNVQFLVPVDGGVSKLQAVLPPAAWYRPDFITALNPAVPVKALFRHIIIVP